MHRRMKAKSAGLCRLAGLIRSLSPMLHYDYFELGGRQHIVESPVGVIGRSKELSRVMRITRANGQNSAKVNYLWTLLLSRVVSVHQSLQSDGQMLLGIVAGTGAKDDAGPFALDDYFAESTIVGVIGGVVCDGI